MGMAETGNLQNYMCFDVVSKQFKELETIQAKKPGYR